MTDLDPQLLLYPGSEESGHRPSANVLKEEELRITSRRQELEMLQRFLSSDRTLEMSDGVVLKGGMIVEYQGNPGRSILILAAGGTGVYYQDLATRTYYRMSTIGFRNDYSRMKGVGAVVEGTAAVKVMTEIMIDFITALIPFARWVVNGAQALAAIHCVSAEWSTLKSIMKRISSIEGSAEIVLFLLVSYAGKKLDPETAREVDPKHWVKYLLRIAADLAYQRGSKSYVMDIVVGKLLPRIRRVVGIVAKNFALAVATAKKAPKDSQAYQQTLAMKLSENGPDGPLFTRSQANAIVAQLPVKRDAVDLIARQFEGLEQTLEDAERLIKKCHNAMSPTA